jgi:hypothetical protein
VYRANLNHPVDLAEHGNAASPARPRDRADLTARRVRGRSLGMTEEAKASGNALDMPTSVWSEMARKLGEPFYSGKANDDRRLSVDASRSCCLKGAQRRAAASQYCQAVRPRLVAGQTAGRPNGRLHEGLSRMRGNSHVRFLGAWAGNRPRLPGGLRRGEGEVTTRFVTPCLSAIRF